MTDGPSVRPTPHQADSSPGLDAGTTIGPRCATIHVGQEARRPPRTGRIYDRSRLDGLDVTIIRLTNREESIYGLLDWYPHASELENLQTVHSGSGRGILLISAAPLLAQGQTDVGIPVTDPLVLAKCGTCHTADEQGNLQRISWARATPEGWQARSNA